MPDRQSAPIDRSALEAIAEIARGHELVASADVNDVLPSADSHAQVVVALDARQYPSSITDARLEVQWYENDDYNLHYRERRPDNGDRTRPDNGDRTTEDADWTNEEDGVWQRRWDRHPNPHDAPREHFHPPPRADSEPIEDPIDPADVSPHYVLSRTLAWIRERIENCWTAVEE